eukprot:Hpha_TRINITY_DN15385_c0_g2::TRINITY_DN15385_c0_g2_i1::g.90070::m.90070
MAQTNSDPQVEENPQVLLALPAGVLQIEGIVDTTPEGSPSPLGANRRESKLSLVRFYTPLGGGSEQSRGFTHLTHQSQQSHAASTITKAELAGIGRASWGSSTANLACSMIGGGMLGLPGAIADCGLLLGSVLMVLSCVLASATLIQLASCGRRLQSEGIPASYYAAAIEAMPRASWIVDVAVVVSGFG